MSVCQFVSMIRKTLGQIFTMKFYGRIAVRMSITIPADVSGVVVTVSINQVAPR